MRYKMNNFWSNFHGIHKHTKYAYNNQDNTELKFSDFLAHRFLCSIFVRFILHALPVWLLEGRGGKRMYTKYKMGTLIWVILFSFVCHFIYTSFTKQISNIQMMIHITIYYSYLYNSSDQSAYSNYITFTRRNAISFLKFDSLQLSILKLEHLMHIIMRC